MARRRQPTPPWLTSETCSWTTCPKPMPESDLLLSPPDAFLSFHLGRCPAVNTDIDRGGSVPDTDRNERSPSRQRNGSDRETIIVNDDANRGRYAVVSADRTTNDAYRSWISSRGRARVTKWALFTDDRQIRHRTLDADSAVYTEYLPRHLTRQWRCEEDDRIGDVLRLAAAAERDP
jgi:hypothetical protein